jgi:hypothetical protein
MRNGQHAGDTINLLMDVHRRGMTFGVSVTQQLPESVAHVLYEAIARPQSHVRSFDFPCAAISEQGEAPAITDILRDCITHCGTLECVSGFPAVLSLLNRSVREIALVVLVPPVASEELLRVLTLGGVEKLSLKSDIGIAHQWVADAVAKANADLPPERSVLRLELRTYANVVAVEKDENLCKEIASRLFSAMHVTRLTLPNATRLSSRHLEEVCAERGSLQSLTLDTRRGLESRAEVSFAMDLLGPAPNATCSRRSWRRGGRRTRSRAPCQ